MSNYIPHSAKRWLTMASLSLGLLLPAEARSVLTVPVTTAVRSVVRAEISGTVTGANGESLPGVNVLLKGTSVGTVTDIDGTYKLSIPDDQQGGTLVFSSISYTTQEVPINGQSIINVALAEDLQQLEEIVVVGYSTQSKKNITGAVSTVDAEELKSVPANNFAQQLQGRVSGVQVGNEGSPGGNVMIRIRGIGSITGGNDPLYVVDGVPTQGDLNLLNPDDIESIQILKDASTASIYGSRASNGVVIVTTKKGKSGEPTISFDSYVGTQRPRKFNAYISPQQNADILWQGLRNSGQVNADTGNPVHPVYGDGPAPTIPDYLIPVGAMEGDPRVDPANYSNNPDEPGYGTTKYQITRTNKEGTDWYDVLLDPAPIQNYNLSISGGSEKGRYAVSAGYFNQQGILKFTNFKRYSLRVNTEFNVKKYIRIGQNLQFSYADKVGVGSRGEFTPIGQVYLTAPIQPVLDIGGNYTGNRDFVIGGPNPYATLERNKNNNSYSPRLFGNLYAEVDFLKHFTARTSLGVDYSAFNYSNFFPFTYENYLTQPQKAVLDVGNNYGIGLTWTNTLTYTQTFAEKHQLTALLGVESVTNTFRSFGTQKAGFKFEDVDYRYLDAGLDITNSSGYGSESSLFSVFAKIDYGYNNKYLLSALVRRDASSRFSPINRWGTFPAFSAGWRISEEGFMQNASFISDLKLRAGWGQTGNQNIDPYNQYDTYVTNLTNSSYDIFGTSTSAVPGFRKYRIGNPNARWEAQTMTNIGLDVALLDSRLSLTVDAYNRAVSDLLLTVPIPATQGQNVPPAVNIGSMRNQGIDIELGYQGDAAGGDLHYSITGNWSTYNNKVTALYGSDDAFITGFGTRIGALTRTQVGHPISSFYGYALDGIFQSEKEAEDHPTQGGNRDLYNQVGRFKFNNVNGDSVIDNNDQTFIGSPIPDFTYGLNVNVAYKNFDLSLFFQGVQGNDIFNYNRFFTDFYGLSYSYGPRMLDSWTPENTDAVLPQLNPNTSAYESQPSSYYLEDGSYFRAKNVQLGYSLPTSLLDRVGINRLRVYVQSQNLFTVTKYSGMDPEVNLAVYGDGADRDIGVDRAIYPIPRSFLVGLQVSF